MLPCLQLILTWCLFWFYWKWNPHMRAWVNYARSATYACIFWCAICLCFVVFKPNVDKTDHGAVYHWQQRLTIILWAGMAPMALFGALASWLRLRYYTVTVLNRFRCACRSAWCCAGWPDGPFS